MSDGYFETVSGTKFHFRSPNLDEIKLSDIAHSLAKSARYNGHTVDIDRHFSVAEHSVLMTLWGLTNRDWSGQMALTCLMHDASEAFLTDVPSPMKQDLPDFKAMEKAFEEVISKKFSLIYPLPREIKTLDGRIVRDERAQAMNDSGHVWVTDRLEPLGVKLMFWSPREARDAFIRTFQSIVEVYGLRCSAL